MNEHVTDRLDDYVEDRLTLGDREDVDRHLSTCDSCAAALRSYDPVTPDDLRLPFDDGDGLRRTVRRAIGRTAVDAAALAVIILVLGVLVSLFVVQPLLINRSNRAVAAARAAYEAPMLFSPGVSVSRLTISSGLVGRTTTVEIDLPLGSSVQPLGSIASEIGVLSVDSQWAVNETDVLVPLSDVLDGVDRGTVITVAFGLPEPLSLGDAQVLADDPGRDVRLTWAGFDLGSSIFGQVGYPLCRMLEAPSDQLLGASSASYGGTLASAPPSVERAATSAREALTAIASNDEVAAALSGAGPGPVESLAEAMGETRSVLSFVVTGPSPEVAGFLRDLGVADGQVLAVGFYSWGSPVCGR
ncbi:MAG TPA: zf-HC2 domain-containing protein [Acidimicrobiia bacterium]|nr:zf-HC2 domain-containing protein [Acidimicrobiia bacterium]